jgi:hypothetical protein
LVQDDDSGSYRRELTGTIIIIDEDGSKILLVDQKSNETKTIAGTGVHGFNGDTHEEYVENGDTHAEQNATQTQLGNLHVHILDFIVMV